MLVPTAEKIHALCPMSRLIECLEEAFRTGSVAPERHVASVPGGSGERLLLLIPAFDSAGGGAVKFSTVCSDNQARGPPTIQGAIVVFSEAGTPTALLGGAAVTRLRTGAASPLASKYLSRRDSSQLLIIGTGALAPYMAMAHWAVRPISRVSISGRSAERESATADIVLCATSRSTPVLAGRWLKRGAFVDFVGSFLPTKREADDDVMRRCRIFVDALEGGAGGPGLRAGTCTSH